jgi:1-acyl-sn-glycerol-3-phosphate acyltransferase
MGLVYETAYYLSRALGHCCFDFRVVNRERIPTEGSLLLAVNHQSFLDPPLVGCACGRDVFYLARKSLSEIPILGGLLPKLNVIPYDQGGSDMSAIKAVIRVLKAGRATLIFPEGTRSRDGSLMPAQPGTGMIVAKTLSPVLPMRIFGAHEAFPKESMRVRLHPITLVVGEVMHFTKQDCEGDAKVVYKNISDSIMERISALRCPERK